MLITYVILCKNEVATINQAVKDILEIDIKEKEIIIIDNKSTDGTIEEIKKIKKKYPFIKIILRPKDMGAMSFIEGKQIAKGEYLYFYHADREYDHLESLKMLEICRKENLDLIFGSRIKKDLIEKGYIGVIKSNYYYLATIIFTKIFNLFYKQNLTDIIGIKLYRTSSIKKIPHICKHQHGNEFEFISRVGKMRLKFNEININYSKRKFGKKSIGWHHFFYGLYIMIKVKFFYKVN